MSLSDDYFTPIRRLERSLRDYGYALSNKDHDEERLLKDAEKFAEENKVGLGEGFIEAVKAKPSLAQEPGIAYDPEDFLIELAEKTAEDQGIELIEAVIIAEREHPQIAKLVELMKYQPERFEAACHEAGKKLGIVGDPTGIISSILEVEQREVWRRQRAERKHFAEYMSEQNDPVGVVHAEFSQGFEYFQSIKHLVRNPDGFEQALERLTEQFLLPPNAADQQQIEKDCQYVAEEVIRAFK